MFAENLFMSKKQKLQKIEKELQKLRRHFPLAKKVVAGEGNPDLKIFILGEAPGPLENLYGRPFVGRAGKMLDKLLASISLSRKKVFITGTVKFYPGRRAPTQKEIALNLPYTLRQINIINPKLIVLLGNVAVKSLLNRKWTVSQIHGKLFRDEHRLYFATFHPAAAMRFPKVLKQTKKDFKELKRIIVKL